MSARRNNRSNGLLLLDKPLDWSSGYTARRAGALLRAKAGHAGTLDPAATGLLLVGVGEGVKTLRYLTHADKTYHARVRMGTRTTTDDRAGEVMETRECAPLSAARVRAMLQRFVGEIEQIPPMYSALKYKGKPLYRYARTNKEAPRAPRRVRLYSLDLLECGADAFCVSVRCSHGTYIRVLARHLGEALGGVAHLGGLRRVSVGGFSVADASPVDAVDETVNLLPPDAGLAAFPAAELDAQGAARLAQGRRVEYAGATEAGRRWRAYDARRVFVGVALAAEVGVLKPERIFHDECAQEGGGKIVL